MTLNLCAPGYLRRDCIGIRGREMTRKTKSRRGWRRAILVSDNCHPTLAEARIQAPIFDGYYCLETA